LGAESRVDVPGLFAVFFFFKGDFLLEFSSGSA